MRNAIAIITLCIIYTGTGCSLISDFGGYLFSENEQDAGNSQNNNNNNNNNENDGGIPTIEKKRIPQSIVNPSGSGVTSSKDYRIDVSIGVPQPMGSLSSTDYKVETGPQSINP